MSKYRVVLRKLSNHGTIQDISVAFETNSCFDKVILHNESLIGINYAFAKVFVHKISGGKWIELDLSDIDVSAKI
jgi:hypothetical protein